MNCFYDLPKLLPIDDCFSAVPTRVKKIMNSFPAVRQSEIFCCLRQVDLSETSGEAVAMCTADASVAGLASGCTVNVGVNTGTAMLSAGAGIHVGLARVWGE